MDKIHSVKARKKPVEIEAIRYTGPQDFPKGVMNTLSAFCGEVPDQVRPDGSWPFDNAVAVWNTKEECWVRCPVGHWIIKGVDGECYPCDHDVFLRTYDFVTSKDDMSDSTRAACVAIVGGGSP